MAWDRVVPHKEREWNRPKDACEPELTQLGDGLDMGTRIPLASLVQLDAGLVWKVLHIQ